MSLKLFDLSGRVALVTGGNGGIGLGMARGMAEAGAAIMVAGRNADKNAAAVAELKDLGAEADAVTVDVTDAASCRAMVDATKARFGRIDCLVNNAGTAIRKQPQDYDLAEWQEVLTTNLTSAFVCSQAVYPLMQAQGGGKIVMIGSMMSIFGASFSAPYASSKGGIVQLGKSLASSWAKDNIQVNTVLPGWIDTALTIRAREQVDGLHQRVLDRTPAGRWGTEDHAGIAVFLASPASDFVTGTSIPVDGGFSIYI
ncbi:MAG: SDR family oxidoreductase [Alphaproteobacteria bacterium]|nr:SDR family oxidoreductase [Alphaproteobacteria bacterium]